MLISFIMAIYNLFKPVGFSPLDLIKIFKEKNADLKESKMTYAGRLDPMAEGVVLILSDEDRFKKDDFLKFDKVYKADILFGVETDTYDVLGIPQLINSDSGIKFDSSIIKSLIGTHLINVPIYSSIIVNSKPLFEFARKDKLDNVKVPRRKMIIKDADYLKKSLIDGQDLLKQIEEKIKLVDGDFRQEEIIKSWQYILKDSKIKFLAIKINLHVTSGTYIRSIAHELGKKLGCGAILLNLSRTSVGKYNIQDSNRIL